MYLPEKLATVGSLTDGDFISFYFPFRRIIENELPSCENVFFLSEKIRGFDTLPSPLQTKLQGHDYTGQNDIVKLVDDTLLLSFKTDNGKILCVIPGVDGYFSEKVSENWLLELRDHCLNQFLLTKKAGIDGETELPNCLYFTDDLAQLCRETEPTLILFEIYPRANSSTESRIHSKRTVGVLRSVLGDSSPLYSLGSHVYGYLSVANNPDKLKNLGKKTVSLFRREGFHRAHAGSRTVTANDDSQKDTIDPEVLYEQAWLSLYAARKKGPFGWCDYESVAFPELHPLKVLSENITRSFWRVCKNSQRFCIAHWEHPESTEFELPDTIAGSSVFTDNEHVFVFFKELNVEEALEQIKRTLGDHLMQSITVGLAQFPYFQFRKQSTLLNSRKAFLHSAFYGPGGIAVFNALSLNVSGDIYYADGDIRKAITEYKMGLQCDSHDVNLLNSLGVCYADINKRALAGKCFTDALKIDPGNFLALYNSAIVAEKDGDLKDAILFYEKARENGQGYSAALDDIELHLGWLYVKEKRFIDAIDMLSGWCEKQINADLKSRAYTHLGQSYFHSGLYKNAEIWLQKALAYDEYDATAMSLLGCVYLKNREGVDIAYSLCKKSADLDPDNLSIKFNLARVLIELEKYEEARSIIRLCLRKKEMKPLAQIYMCRSYIAEGVRYRAQSWLDKILSVSSTGFYENEVIELKKEFYGSKWNKRKEKDIKRA